MSPPRRIFVKSKRPHSHVVAIAISPPIVGRRVAHTHPGMWDALKQPRKPLYAATVLLCGLPQRELPRRAHCDVKRVALRLKSSRHRSQPSNPRRNVLSLNPG